jgi:uncharacterized protein YciI
MKKVILLFLFGLVFSLSVDAQDEIKISLKNGNKAEQQTKEQLQRLLENYDLSKWIMTKSILIDEKTAIPHSHPVLTLNTDYLKDDELLLATYVHEQIHWFVIKDQNALAAAIKEFKTMFPTVPSAGPEGARNESSTYLHIAVCYLEYLAMRELLGELKAKQVMDFWATHHYTWIYKTVLVRSLEIGKIMFKYNLIPKISTQKAAQNSTGQQKTKSDQFNSGLAARLGADDYGMKTYIFVILKSGKAKIEDAETRKKLSEGHLKNIVRLSEEGKLVMAGPFLQAGENRGIYVFDVRTVEEAEKLVATDPAIKAGLFDVEMFRWYGSAALPELSEIHKKIQKKNSFE